VDETPVRPRPGTSFRMPASPGRVAIRAETSADRDARSRKFASDAEMPSIEAQRRALRCVGGIAATTARAAPRNSRHSCSRQSTATESGFGSRAGGLESGMQGSVPETGPNRHGQHSDIGYDADRPGLGDPPEPKWRSTAHRLAIDRQGWPLPGTVHADAIGPDGQVKGSCPKPREAPRDPGRSRSGPD
jgi:hypothetical protein